MQTGSTRWFNDHGISPEVRKGRPYIRWTKDDRGPVRKAYEDLPRGSRGFMSGIAGQSDGLVIVRHAPPGLDLPHVYAEIRPDEPVVTGPGTWHYHPSDPSGDAPEHPKRYRTYTLEHMRKCGHIERDKKNPDDHRGVNREDVHMHTPRAKYVFPPGPKKAIYWYHDHEEKYAGKTDKRDAHVQRYHGGVDQSGRHSHVRMVKDEDQSLARKLDVHPLALPMFETAERVFFVIEGCIKADAILSAGEAVFSVPSVTLWNADELPAFAAKYLQGKTVYIVPDSDWAEKNEVFTQAMYCRTFLRKLGIDALIAAPPPDESGDKQDDKQGVDDFLGAGGSVDDLIVLDREPPLVTLELVARADRIARDVQVLDGLILHAGEDGSLGAPLGKFARVMGLDRFAVSRALEALQDLGAIEVDGPLVTRAGTWYGNRYIRSFDWADRPTITIRPDLRATTTFRPLAEDFPRKANVEELRLEVEALLGEIMVGVERFISSRSTTRAGRSRKKRYVKDGVRPLLIRFASEAHGWGPRDIERRGGVPETTARRILKGARNMMSQAQLDRIEAKVDRIGEWFPDPVREAEGALSESDEVERSLVEESGPTER
jgi:hypothetical protein